MFATNWGRKRPNPGLPLSLVGILIPLERQTNKHHLDALIKVFAILGLGWDFSYAKSGFVYSDSPLLHQEIEQLGLPT